MLAKTGKLSPKIALGALCQSLRQLMQNSDSLAPQMMHELSNARLSKPARIE
jgi:hypothetical protein